MLPTTGPGGTTLTAVTRGSTAVPFTTMTVKGQEYAVFPAAGGAHQASYGTGGANLVSAAQVTPSATGDATATWTTEQPGTSVVRLGTSPARLSARVSIGGRTTEHLAELDGLAPATRYYYRLESRGPRGTTTVWPAASAAPASFTTAGGDRAAPRIRSLRVVPMPDGTARVIWRTDEPATSRLRYGPDGRALHGVGIDDRLVRRHVVVVTGLAPERAYAVRVESRDAAGNVGRGRVTTFRSQARGIAMFTVEDFRTGATDGRTAIDDRGLGSLTLEGPGSGSYTSRVVDSGRKATWRRLVLDADQPAGARVVVRVRAGDRSTPDATWSPWVLATTSSRLDLGGRYVQYTVHLSTSSRALPRVAAIGITRTGGGATAAED
jgi:chitodextrinase